jgi:membrane protein DedA with SNARE-associated domain
MMGIPFWKFTAIDGTAALLTVPTQVLLVSYYGGWMLEHFKVVKVVLLCVIGIFVLYHVIQWYRSRTSRSHLA